MSNIFLLRRNIIFNIVGYSISGVVAFFAIPLLIDKLGLELFGILTLVWMLIGYFSIFDFGLGRALTYLIAEKLGINQNEEIPTLVWSSIFLLMILGVVGMFTFVLCSHWLVYDILKIPNALKHETLQAFYLLAISIPFLISTPALVGVLGAMQRFDLINTIRIPISFFTFLGPVFVLSFSKSIVSVAAILVLTQLFSWSAYLFFCIYVIPSLRYRIIFQRKVIRPLISFGSWMTVSNIISSLLVYLDRFLIGILIPIVSVAYYTTPYEIVTKLWFIPWSVVSVLFPIFTASFVQDRSHTIQLFYRGVKYIFFIMFPIVLLIVIFSALGLRFWLGNEFSKHSTRVLQWLTIGVFINSIAQIPFTLIQSIGRPDIVAKLHLIELPFYLPVMLWLISIYGIEGAAISWTARVTLDAVLLFWITHLLLSTRKSVRNKP